jgi:hypothetical protein
VPSADAPGSWVEVEPPLAPTSHGVHAVGSAVLLDWLDDELWEIELGGQIIESGAMLVAQRGRLLRRVAAWDGDAARALARSCLPVLRDVACEVLERHGAAGTARALGELGEPAALYRFATAHPSAGEPPELALTYLADVASLSLGGRQESFPDAAGAGAPSTPAAVAVNTCFVTAAAIGMIAMREDPAPAAFAVGFGRERCRQQSWLADRLGLELGVPVSPAGFELADELQRLSG